MTTERTETLQPGRFNLVGQQLPEDIIRQMERVEDLWRLHDQAVEQWLRTGSKHDRLDKVGKFLSATYEEDQLGKMRSRFNDDYDPVADELARYHRVDPETMDKAGLTHPGSPAF